MRTIKKYALTSGATFKVKLPKGYAILRVGIEERCPHLWAIVDTSNVDVMALMYMANTNAAIPGFEGLQYIGSLQIPGNPFYSHLFHDTKGDVDVAVPHPPKPAAQEARTDESPKEPVAGESGSGNAPTGGNAPA